MQPRRDLLLSWGGRSGWSCAQRWAWTGSPTARGSSPPAPGGFAHPWDYECLGTRHPINSGGTEVWGVHRLVALQQQAPHPRYDSAVCVVWDKGPTRGGDSRQSAPGSGAVIFTKIVVVVVQPRQKTFSRREMCVNWWFPWATKTRTIERPFPRRRALTPTHQPHPLASSASPTGMRCEVWVPAWLHEPALASCRLLSPSGIAHGSWTQPQAFPDPLTRGPGPALVWRFKRDPLRPDHKGPVTEMSRPIPQSSLQKTVSVQKKKEAPALYSRVEFFTARAVLVHPT